MDIKDICNAGGDILDAVADAINRNDYSGLSENVSNTVNRVVSQVKEEAGKGTYGDPTHQYGRTSYTRKGQASYRSIYEKEEGRYASIYKHGSSGRAEDGKKVNYDRKEDNSGRMIRDRHAGGIGRQLGSVLHSPNLPPAVTKHPSGRITGPLQLGWGILATCGFGITAVVMLIMLLVQGGTVFVVLSAVFTLLTMCSISDIVRGSRKIGLINRFYQYARLIGEKGYIAIEELALQTGQHRDRVLNDLKKMMKKHMFLQGRLDSSQTVFMLTQEAYQQYLEAENSLRSAEAEEQRRQEQARVQAEEAARHQALDNQTQKILKDGNAYIRMVHECNEKIRSEEMSYKLSRLEVIMRRIFEHVEKTPESADDLHKFMDYYLPTTTKLLNAYIDLDRQEIAGENISTTKKEIEDTLDTINVAFEKLLDGLFEETAWDISSDISVMKTMMAQEGLTENKDFKLNK